MSELRITDTNSANDSPGRALGLDGNDFLYVVGAIVGALACYLLLTALLHVGALVALLLSAPMLAGPVAWVLLLRHHKPAGYAGDLFDHLVNGEGWSFAPHAQPARPNLSRDERRRP